jgi:hypothetical protein
MKIKRLNATFGNLENAELTFGNGLNIIQAPNEYGKSTWCAFIRTMLFGLNTADRDKTGYLADKTRYRPWNGSAMGGVMELNYNGSDITIQRTSLGKSPMKKFSAEYSGTNEPVDFLSSETAGETLTGMTEKVFERSAFIRQSGMRIQQTGDLEKRIAMLISTGEEDGVSYSEADKKLRTWLRKRQYNKTGTIPELEKRLQKAETQLFALGDAHDSISSMRLELERLEQRKADLETELNRCIQYENAQQIQRVHQAKSDAEHAIQQVKNLQAKLGDADTYPSELEISHIRNKLAELHSLETLAIQAAEEQTAAQYNYDVAISRKNNDSMSHFEASYISEQANNAVRLQQTTREKTVKNRTASIILLIAVVLAVLTGILTDGYLRIGAFVLAALCCIGTIWYTISSQKAKNQLSALLSVFQVPSVDALVASATFYTKLCTNAAVAEQALSEASTRVFNAEKNLSDAKSALLTQIRPFAPAASSVTEIQASLSEIESMTRALDRAKADADAAYKLYSTLAESCTCSTEECITADLSSPERNRADVQNALRQTDALLDTLRSRYNLALGELRSLGDPVVLAGTQKSTEEKLSTVRCEYDALTLAIETLDAANTELQSRFSPVISRKAGEIYQQLTGGRYDSLTFDKSLSASAKRTGEPVSHDLLSLSAGTGDQVYLALRLAICGLISDPENPCPIILDDALVHFDDARANAALDYFRCLAETRQVILFTCHSREAFHFAHIPNVNIQKLD